MPFLNALLLYGTALGAIPVIIHLLNKRRFRPVTWAAMEFLLQAIQQNARRLQFRDLILMLIRTAAVVFLALALARPTLFSKSFLGGGQTAAVILLDNSMSMGYNAGRETRFEVARRLAKSVISQLERGSWCALYTFNDEVRAPIGDPSQNLPYITEELDHTVQLSDGGTDIEKALQRVQKLFQERQEYKVGSREIYIITDMQARPWNTREVSGRFKDILKELSANATVYLLNAGDGATENVAVLDLAPADTLVTVDTTVQFVAKIKNFGTADVQSLPIDVYVDSQPGAENAEQKHVLNVRGGETASLSFELQFKTGGDHKIEVRLANDHLSADDRRFCSIQVIEETHVLLVDGRDQHSDDPLSSETAYLRSALSPQDPDNPEKQGVIVTETVPQGRLGDKNLLNYQTVVLSNVSKLAPTTINVLQTRVRAGMGLIIFLGDQIDPSQYESLLGENAARLLPAKIGAPWGEALAMDAHNSPTPFSFAVSNLSHPIMSDFNNPDGGTELLNAVKIYKAFDLQAYPDDSVRLVAALSNGKPAILERKYGSGSVLLFAFPATTAWGNLPWQPTFAIVMLRAANLLALGNRPPKNLPVNATIHSVVPLADQNTPVHIAPPPPLQKKDTKPELSTDGAAAVDFNDTDRAGFYDVVLDRVPRLTMSYALNPKSDTESDLTTVEPERLKTDYPDFKFAYVGRAEDFTAKVTDQRHGTEIWPWLLGIVFVLLGFESVLAHRWAPRD